MNVLKFIINSYIPRTEVYIQRIFVYNGFIFYI
jgi:hypothetical protein